MRQHLATMMRRVIQKAPTDAPMIVNAEVLVPVPHSDGVVAIQNALPLLPAISQNQRLTANGIVSA